MCVNTGCGGCVDNCGCTCQSCCNNDCGNCQDPCAQNPCGCPFEVSTACVRIDVAALSCLNIEKGHTLEDALQSINSIICDLSTAEDGIDGDSAYQIWLNLGNAGTEQDFIDSLIGATGQGIDNVAFTSSSLGGAAGQPGATDTYTFWADAGQNVAVGTFDVYNGVDGADGADGDNFGLASIIDSSGAIFNTTVESSLQGNISGSFLIPAGDLVLGNSYQLQASGDIYSDAATNLNIRFKSNGAEIAGTGDFAMPSVGTPFSGPVNWYLDLTMTVRTIGINGSIAISGTFYFHSNTAGELKSYPINNIVTGFNTTVNNTFDATAQWSFAEGSNTIECQTMIFNRLK